MSVLPPKLESPPNWSRAGCSLPGPAPSCQGSLAGLVLGSSFLKSKGLCRGHHLCFQVAVGVYPPSVVGRCRPLAGAQRQQDTPAWLGLGAPGRQPGHRRPSQVCPEKLSCELLRLQRPGFPPLALTHLPPPVPVSDVGHLSGGREPDLLQVQTRAGRRGAGVLGGWPPS